MKILAIDDDRAGAPVLEHHCRAILANRLERFARADSRSAATAQLAAADFDVVLLDPALHAGDGLNLLADRDGRGVPTIVVSARTDLAMRAFEFGVLDFVPKPVQPDRLAKALCRVVPRAPGPTAESRMIAVRRHGRIEFVPLDDLLYVEGSDKYSELVLNNGQRSFHDKCLSRVEATLPRSFVRIHKSYLVRFNAVSRLIVQRGSRYFAELKSGQRLPVGRSRYSQVKSRLI
jgi:two-component system response regulator LytT